MKKILIIVFVFALSLVILNYLPVHGEEAVYDSVVRLHVVANSDTDADQELKLKVRDAVIVDVSTITRNCASREEALTALAEALPQIEQTARETVRAEGYDYPVSVSLGEELYPRKSYEDVCFPAGEYQSLQIKIGESEGKNWWCVLFPEMCMSGAKGAEEAFVQVGLTSDQYKIITETDEPKYKIRFKILETAKKWKLGN